MGAFKTASARRPSKLRMRTRFATGARVGVMVGGSGVAVSVEVGATVKVLARLGVTVLFGWAAGAGRPQADKSSAARRNQRETKMRPFLKAESFIMEFILNNYTNDYTLR